MAIENRKKKKERDDAMQWYDDVIENFKTMVTNHKSYDVLSSLKIEKKCQSICLKFYFPYQMLKAITKSR